MEKPIPTFIVVSVAQLGSNMFFFFGGGGEKWVPSYIFKAQGDKQREKLTSLKD